MANFASDGVPAVFLDRDGVLNSNRDDYVKTLDELLIFPFAGDAVAKLNAEGFLVLVISNQQAIGKGLMTWENLAAIEAEIVREVESKGGKISGFYYCPHLATDECDCRKPRIGNVLKAASEHSVDISRSYFVGDSQNDIETAKNAGMKVILVLGGKLRPEHVPDLPVQPDAVCADLADAADCIVTHSRGEACIL